jgi:predicted nuclease of predicted toxin-antitoxin system
MKRIVLDQGLPATAAVILPDGGWDAVGVREIAMNEATDGETLDYAARESRVVITLDRDFPQILALTAATRPSVVLIRQQRLRAAELAALIASILRDYENVLERGMRPQSRRLRDASAPLSAEVIGSSADS